MFYIRGLLSVCCMEAKYEIIIFFFSLFSPVVKNAWSDTEQVMEAAHDKAAAVRPLTTYQEKYQNWTNQACRTLREK